MLISNSCYGRIRTENKCRTHPKKLCEKRFIFMCEINLKFIFGEKFCNFSRHFKFSFLINSPRIFFFVPFSFIHGKELFWRMFLRIFFFFFFFFFFLNKIFMGKTHFGRKKTILFVVFNEKICLEKLKNNKNKKPD